MKRREMLRVLGSAAVVATIPLDVDVEAELQNNQYRTAGTGPTVITFDRSPVGYFDGLTDRYRLGATSPDWSRDGAAYSVLAMAQYQLKRSDEARAALAKGVDIVNSKLPKLQNGALGENWIDWLIAHILLREAKALIEGQADLHSSSR